VKRFRGGLVFKAHRRLCHSSLGWIVIKKKKGGASTADDRRVLVPEMLQHELRTLEHLGQDRGLRVWFRGGLVFKAHRLVYHSTLGWRVIKKKRGCGVRTRVRRPPNRACTRVGPTLTHRHAGVTPDHKWELAYRGTSLIRKRHPSRNIIGP